MATTVTTATEQDELTARMAVLGIREEEIDETFVRSGGHGGQNVNKVATCVMLLHRPTGVQVKCQETREQARNRVIARRLLVEKLEQRQRERETARRAEVEKERRKKRGRSRAAKQRMLADKARRSEKKSLRQRKFD
jgi:protein subunit release factor B